MSWLADYFSAPLGFFLIVPPIPASFHSLRPQRKSLLLNCILGTAQDVGAYLAASEEQQFDLVVAAETLQYLGPLEDVVADTFKVLKPGGYFSFTVDRRRTGEETEDEDKEEHERGPEGGRREQVGGWKNTVAEVDATSSVSHSRSPLVVFFVSEGGLSIGEIDGSRVVSCSSKFEVRNNSNY